MNEEWKPTARLRFVKREVPLDEPTQLVTKKTVRILQQWWAADVPGYMRRDAEGEWKDVECVEESDP